MGASHSKKRKYIAPPPQPMSKKDIDKMVERSQNRTKKVMSQKEFNSLQNIMLMSTAPSAPSTIKRKGGSRRRRRQTRKKRV